KKGQTIETKTKDRTFLILLALFISIIIGCASQRGGIKRPCPCNIPGSPRPAWVLIPPGTNDYYIGVASAICSSDSDQCYVEADRKARNELAKQIRVEVESFVEDHMKYIAEGESDVFKQEIETISREHVNLVLKEVTIAKRWFEEVNCTLWSMARLSKAQYKKDKEELERKLAKTVKRKRFMVGYCSKGEGDLAGDSAAVVKAVTIIQDALVANGIHVKSAPDGSICFGMPLPRKNDVDVLVTFRIWDVKVIQSSDEALLKVTLKLNARATNVITSRYYSAADQIGEAMTRADKPNLEKAKYKAAMSAASKYADLLVQRIEELSRVD
ncbi:hypothetical protein ACFL4G_10370, partial [Thermodesulfobacteriota bacterium]